MHKFPTSKKRKSVSIEEAEIARRKQEYERQLQVKADLLEKEFMKMEQQKKLQESAAFSNEVNLRRFLDELLTSNNQKNEELFQINEQLANIERKETDGPGKWNSHASVQWKSMQSSSKSVMSKTAVSYMPFSYKPSSEELIERMEELRNTLQAVESQLEVEEETQGTLDNKIILLTNDKNILVKRNKDLENTLNHAFQRFNHTENVDFLANAKLNEAKNSLAGYQKSVNSVDARAHEFLGSISKEKKEEARNLQDVKVQMSQTLLKIDEHHKLLEKYEQEISALDKRLYEVMNKKSDSKYTSEYIDVLTKLQQEYLRSESDDEERLKKSKTTQAVTEEENLPRKPSLSVASTPRKRTEQRTHSGTPESRKRTFTPSALKEISAFRSKYHSHSGGKQSGDLKLTQDHIFYKVQAFYQSLKHGPDQLAEELLKKYQQLSFQESSLKRASEDLINLKARKQAELFNLTRDNDELKRRIIERKNQLQQAHCEDAVKDTAQTEENAKESDTKEETGNALDAGMIGYGAVQSTVNQAMFDTADSAAFDQITKEHNKKQSFIIRVYSDFIQLLFKLSSLLHAISEQSLYGLPPELERLSHEMFHIVKDYRTNKNKLENSMNPSQMTKADAIRSNQTETQSHGFLARIDTYTSVASEQPKEDFVKETQTGTLSANELKNAFLSVFPNCSYEANEFVALMKNDLFVNNFLTIDDVRSFLSRFGPHDLIAGRTQVGRALEESQALQEDGVDCFIKRFHHMVRQYIDFIEKLLKNTDELSKIVSFLEGDTQRVQDLELESGSREVTRNLRPLELPSALKEAQAKRLTSILNADEITSATDLATDARTNKRQPKNQSQTHYGSLTNEEFRERLTQLTMVTLEKKRGYYYNDLQYGYKSKAQREKEEFLKEFNEKSKGAVVISEQEYMEQERQAIREKEAEKLEKKRRQDLGLDKEPEKTSFQVTFDRVLKTKPPSDKARMLNNSNILSQIHLIESQVKHKKPVFFVHKLSKELVKKYEAPLSPSKKRSKSNQLKPISEESPLKGSSPVNFGLAHKKLAKTLRVTTAQYEVPRIKSSGTLTNLTVETDSKHSRPFAKSRNMSTVHISTSPNRAKNKHPPSRSSVTTKASESRLPKIPSMNNKIFNRNSGSMPPSTRSSIDWKPGPVEPYFNNLYGPTFFATAFEPMEQNLFQSAERKPSILVGERPI